MLLRNVAIASVDNQGLSSSVTHGVGGPGSLTQGLLTPGRHSTENMLPNYVALVGGGC